MSVGAAEASYRKFDPKGNEGLLQMLIIKKYSKIKILEVIIHKVRMELKNLTLEIN